ncbi:hypothetical protein NDU88_006891 [Pleurodeles waltl]|uniref:Uncharacterized protein n=1 Tax=Pleurodeles waltl TaxID=8319 RepID=A0AAV7VR03_PLEWA|nr:hypothetical protein NDU88_006891 [Pleurodeles waltl]
MLDSPAPEGPAERLLVIAPVRAALPRNAGAELRTDGLRSWAPPAVPVRAADQIGPPDVSGGLRSLLLLGAAASSGEAGRGGNKVGGPRTAAATPGPLCWVDRPGTPGGG